jgi:hypothetical protein
MDKHAPGRLGSVLRFLASTELALFLFLGIAVVAIPGTLAEKSPLYSSPYFVSLLAAFGCNLALCTISRFRTIHWAVLVVHVGVLVVLLGSVVKSLGFVATVNAYEKDVVTEFFRWDLERDLDLGFSVVVRKIHKEFYPMPIKIGVRKNGLKDGLHILKTGESFSFSDGYRVETGPLEYLNGNITLTVFRDNRRVGSYQTATKGSDFPPGFPYTFELVAYQNPRPKKEWLDLAILKDGRVVAEGTSGINNPFVWNRYAIYNPGNNLDKNGVPYAGIQVVRDPGMPLVFSGLTIMGVGVVISSLRRLNGNRRKCSATAPLNRRDAASEDESAG